MNDTKKLIASTLDMDIDDVLTAKEAARMLNIQHGSVLKAISRGRLKADKVGNMYYTTRQAVERYAKERKHE